MLKFNTPAASLLAIACGIAVGSRHHRKKKRPERHKQRIFPKHTFSSNSMA